ncbi:hypothetical protein M758_2G176800 [Ceratodon purpureus]|nr:hypothetical protein M758_2G176800 [Ceratodon purpureus]
MASGRKIMVAVDDSEVSAYAFTWALHNLVRKSDQVIVLTAAPFVDVTYPSSDMAAEYGPTVIPSEFDTENKMKNVNADAKELIAKCISQCNQADISCTGEVVKGDAGTWIVDEANRLGADVIVVGSKGSGVLKRVFMGSNSDYVLHNATCPVAVVRHVEEDLKVHDPLSSSGGSRKVVIAVDESREAVYAFKWALENFANEEDKVILYHVNQSVPPVTTAGTGEFGMEEVCVPTETLGKTEVQALDESEKLVEKYMEYAAKETKIKCEGIVVSGQPEVKVIEGLTNLQADAVIIGTHDRGSLSRTLLSSVTDYLANNSPCPLIVARMPKIAAEPETEAASEHKRST